MDPCFWGVLVWTFEDMSEDELQQDRMGWTGLSLNEGNKFFSTLNIHHNPMDKQNDSPNR